jgi:alpha,alpha-trehalase
MSRKAEATPQELYGPLLAAVQEADLLADGKTFVDAVPRRPIPDILSDFGRLGGDRHELLRFVADNFDLPASAARSLASRPTLPLREHIRSLWADLARDPEEGAANSSALPVGHRHVVPGGRFREIYYWDSFFTMLGLLRDGETALATGIVDAMTDLIEDHGHVPNGARTYFLGRSQPPLYHMMVALLDDSRPAVARRRLEAMKREYDWWMAGAEALAPGERAQRVARLPDGSLLNRYWDPRGTPRDESWREDVETARKSSRAAEIVYRELRAGAESGWDFSSRWLAGGDLSSIRTTDIVPVDLNAFLYGLECAIARGGDYDAERYRAHADARRSAMHEYMWHAQGGFFADYDLGNDSVQGQATAAALAPLMTGVATDGQARATSRFVRSELLAAGGLRTSLVRSGQQWDSPNGWAPLQWIAVTGLRRYGHGDLAREIAMRWIATVERTFDRTGLLFEKYNIEDQAAGEGGEYPTQVGFGWTNGVTADFMETYCTG